MWGITSIIFTIACVRCDVNFYVRMLLTIKDAHKGDTIILKFGMFKLKVWACAFCHGKLGYLFSLKFTYLLLK